MRVQCPACGDRYHIHETHECTSGLNTVADARIDQDMNERRSVLVGVRMTASLARKLDKARGGITRPAKICEILEREL